MLLNGKDILILIRDNFVYSGEVVEASSPLLEIIKKKTVSVTNEKSNSLIQGFAINDGLYVKTMRPYGLSAIHKNLANSMFRKDGYNLCVACIITGGDNILHFLMDRGYHNITETLVVLDVSFVDDYNVELREVKVPFKGSKRTYVKTKVLWITIPHSETELKDVAFFVREVLNFKSVLTLNDELQDKICETVEREE